MARYFVLAVALAWLAPSAVFAQGGNVVVAVMPFRDLAGSKNPVGDAIRESVTSDLRQVPGVRVVERSEIERVINEQQLQGKEIDQDPLATLRIGKLIGANLMAIGAYQQAGRRVRLTARFVRVETGEVVGTAKVDGDQSEFLTLQDRVTVELLKSAKLAPPVVERFARRARPKLRSIRTVELYGRAVKEKDEPTRRAILREAVKADPQYSYANDELSVLEKKLREIEARQTKEQLAELARVQKAYAEAKTIEERYPLWFQLSTQLKLHRRYFEDLRNWRAWRDELKRMRSDKAAAHLPTVWQQLITALANLNLDDEVLKEGEAFIAQHPEAKEFGGVKQALERVIEKRRKQQAGREKAKQEVAKLTSSQRWNLCRVAREYEQESQLVEARRLYLACLEAGTDARAATLADLVEVSVELADFKTARHYAQLLEEESPETYFQRRWVVENKVPVDE